MVGLVAQHHVVMEPKEEQEVAPVHLLHMVVRIVREMARSMIAATMDTALHMEVGDNGLSTHSVVRCVGEEYLRGDETVIAQHQQLVVMPALVKVYQEWSVMGHNVQVNHL